MDDDITLLGMVEKFFTRQGYQVFSAENGEQGFEIFQDRNPDIVLVDLNMPKIDGFEVLRQITQDSPDTPVIVVSGEGKMGDVIQALRMGAWNYHTKPVENLAIIQHAVEQALEKSRLKKENKAYQKGLETKLQTIIENFDGFIFTCDNQCSITYTNPAMTNFAGRDITGESCHEILFDSADHCPWCTSQVAIAGQPERYQFQSPKDGRWYDVICNSIVDRNGQIEQRQIILLDITETKQQVLDLTEREESLRRENLKLRATLTGHYKFGEIIGKSQPMQEVYETIINAACSDSSVIIYGESGTGKELVAKAIHQHSDRHDQKLVYVNCGAIPENLIESEFFGYKKGAFSGAIKDKYGLLDIAGGGTLFLDEVGEIPLNMQVKLLRAIEGGGFSPLGSTEVKKPDVRIIAATNRNLKELVRQGKMRRDFLYRIHIIPVYLPPLRERKEDIRLLVEHFLEQYDRDRIPPFTGKMRKALHSYDWPGNIRELQNTINRFVTLKKLDFVGLELDDDAEEESLFEKTDLATGEKPLATILEDIEKKILFNALQKNQWHKGNTASFLKIDPKTLYRKMKQHDLQGD